MRTTSRNILVVFLVLYLVHACGVFESAVKSAEGGGRTRWLPALVFPPNFPRLPGICFDNFPPFITKTIAIFSLLPQVKMWTMTRDLERGDDAM